MLAKSQARIVRTAARLCLARRARLAAIAALVLAVAFAAPYAARAQDKPDFRVEDDCVVIAYATDGRIAYSVEHTFRVKKAMYRRDDIWIVTPQGSKRRLIEGEKFVRGTAPFSYVVDSLTWSLDGKQLAAQLTTDRLTDAKGKALPQTETLLLDDSGREITVSGGDSLVPAASDPMWLADDATVAYLGDPAPPAMLHSINEIVPSSGKATQLFGDRGIATVAWDLRLNGGIAISTTAARNSSAHLVIVDFIDQTMRELAPLDGYVGGLTVSPSGRLAAYFIDPEVLEVRDLTDPRRVGRAHIAFGKYCWSADETRILLKRGADQHQADLVWVPLPPLDIPPKGQDPSMTEPDPQPIFHDLEYPNFAISPDGHSIAVIEFGRGWLMVYPLPE
jgi:hypothetical protein